MTGAHSLRHLYLVGMMGAGKSTVGRVLADRTRAPFVDIDQRVVSVSGRSIPELFDQSEEHFRQLESSSLAEVGSGSVPTVIAVGGGAVLSDENRSLMKGTGIVVWLRAMPSTLRDRVDGGRGRPVLSRSGDLDQVVEALVRERAPYYADVADLVVDVDGLDVDDVVRAVMRDLPGVGPAGTGWVGDSGESRWEP
ncbi:MAG: shikimate kinase [Actinomycetota bacterium]|nr:shikimate kinase [Actinomycetota bacterium]